MALITNLQEIGFATMKTHSLNDVAIANCSDYDNYYSYPSDETIWLWIGVLRVKRLFVACKTMLRFFIEALDSITNLKGPSYKFKPL